MTQETNHTPLPWKTNYTGNIWGDINNSMHDGDSPLICSIMDSELPNAEFIVRACNSHYELLKLLKKLSSHFSDEIETTIAKAEGK